MQPYLSLTPFRTHLQVETGAAEGGYVYITGGQAAKATGGSIIVATGYSQGTSSGVLVLETANAGPVGGSGTIAMTTGATTVGSTGNYTSDPDKEYPFKLLRFSYQS